MWKVYFAVKYVLTYHDSQCWASVVMWPNPENIANFYPKVYNYLATAPEQLSNSKVETSKLFAARVPSCSQTDN